MNNDDLSLNEYLNLRLECLRMALSLEYFGKDHDSCYKMAAEFLEWLLGGDEVGE